MGGGNVSPQQVVQILNREKAMVIDVRDAEAFAQGHVIGAKNIPFEDLESQANKLNKYKQRPVILVCRSGQKALQAVAKLKKSGFEQAMALTGGIDGWVKADLPLVKGKK